MFQHLNQVNFRGLGTVLPEKEQITQYQNCHTLELRPDTTPVYRAQGDTWLSFVSGNTILSVSEDRVNYRDFYLDKPVLLQAGVSFALTAFRANSSVQIAAEVLPVLTGTRPGTENDLVHPELQVDCLYTFFYQEKEKGFLFPGEAHAMLELTYVDQGALHSVADGQDLVLRQGDMVLYGPNQWHMQYAEIDVAPRYVTISFDTRGRELSNLYNRVFKSPQKAVNLLQLMLREQERMDAYSNDMIISLLTQVLLTLQRESEAPAEKLKTSHSLHNENEIIRRAQQYISTHIREKLSVPITARNVDVSPSYLTALFHKHLQLSPGEYIRRIKLQESKQMIREDTMNFTEIAAALQYSTVHHFSRQFKEKFGITPTEYAKSVR